MRTPTNSSTRLGLVLFSLGAALHAQLPGPPEIAISRVETHRAVELDLPAPPKRALDQAPKGPLPEVPSVDAGLPQPASRPVTVGDMAAQPAAGAFQFFRVRDHRPTGSTRLNPGEPSAAAQRDTWFATGNTYGSLSRDSGMSWSYVNPYTLFPANDGGVCCDQRVLAERLGLTLWFIQYSYSATTGNGGFRLAFARNREDLRANIWNSVYYNAANFGLAGNWLDFPDIALSAEHVYIATNVFNSASVYQNSLVIRIPIAQIRQGSTIVASYYRRSGGSGPMGGGASYRFAQSFYGNPSTAMYWASHNSTSSTRVFRWDDSAGARSADVDRSIPAWTSGAGSSVGPDGRDWLGFDDHRIASGYVNTVFNEVGFLWSSNGNGGSRPQSYVRVQVFNPADRTVIATEDVWNASFDFGYPAVGLNSLGHAGVVMSGGSAGTNVTTYAFLSDNYTPFFAGATIFALATGANGAPSNRWGDYHSVVANPIDQRTFLGTGMDMQGGTSTANMVHRTAWFGRDDYTPAWVSLSVNSAGVSGVPITVAETDHQGNRNGSTPFTRLFTPQQAYTLTAPATFVSAGQTYLFSGWTGTGGSVSTTTYTVDNIGVAADSATANYALQSTITVDDRNVAGAVAITVGTLDLDGLGNGSTRFTRRYRSSDGPFVFTAPAQAGNQRFRRWYLGGVAQAIGQTTLSVSPGSSALTIEAEYCSFQAGAIVAYGTGCVGSNSQVPSLSSTSSPEIGRNVTFNLANHAGATPAVLTLGFSRTSWNGAPLPLNLGFIGANPACNVLAEPLVSIAVAVNLSGTGSLTFPLVNDPNTIGGHLYAQVTAVDVFVPFRVPLVLSNGLDVLLGGSSLGGFTCP